MLSYMPRNKARHEYFSVTPEGMKYRQQIFPSLSSMIRWFKEHFRDPIPGGGLLPGSPVWCCWAAVFFFVFFFCCLFLFFLGGVSELPSQGFLMMDMEITLTIVEYLECMYINVLSLSRVSTCTHICACMHIHIYTSINIAICTANT